MLKRLPLTENTVSTERHRIVRPFLGLGGEKVPIKMVKMEEFTPTGGEESVRSMAEINDGGHECVMVEDGKDGKPVEMENRSDTVINGIQHDDDANCFMQYKERWKENAHLCKNKQEFEFIMDLERMENRQLTVLLDMFYERQQQQQQQ